MRYDGAATKSETPSLEDGAPKTATAGIVSRDRISRNGSRHAFLVLRTMPLAACGLPRQREEREMNCDIADAKRKLPLPAVLHRLGLGEYAKKSARCPFHDDKHNSFSVWKNGIGLCFWKCHAGCGEGDEINFLEKHHSISNKESTKLFLEMAGVNGATPTPRNARSTPTLDWPACVEAFTNKHLQRLAK